MDGAATRNNARRDFYERIGGLSMAPLWESLHGELASDAADGKQVFFLDIGAKFLEADGSLSKNIMPDFLHLSPAGYQIWADAIQEKLAELLK